MSMMHAREQRVDSLSDKWSEVVDGSKELRSAGLIVVCVKRAGAPSGLLR